jgi:hypothetical protein
MEINDWETRRAVIDDEVFELLVSRTGCGPFDGCCLVVAQAFQEVIGGDLVVLVRDNLGSADHAAVLFDDKLWDFDGPLPPADFVERFVENEMPGPGNKCGGFRPLAEGDLPDAIRDPGLVEAMTNVLRSVLPEYRAPLRP